MVYQAPVKRVLISEEQIDARVKELAKQISADYAGKKPLLVCILRGASIFFANLVKNMEIDCTIDFMSLSSYQGTSSSGKVRMLLDIREDIKDKHLIIVEDIVDTGLTGVYLRDMLTARKPASVEFCTLLDKPQNRKVEIKPKYLGFTIQNEFVVGYGLDYNELYRNLPYVGVFDETKK
ncbi:MAG: hypoxanthine phosphoribosyltransferase [Elusimicrobiaceae bacterium]|nr:hypoxanthine phosphoribosyltransferase [Elusimicrobiaceae bacterium]